MKKTKKETPKTWEAKFAGNDRQAAIGYDPEGWKIRQQNQGGEHVFKPAE